jgi:hypothetical protein
MAEVAASIATWLGVSLVVLSDGRRGLAAGIALAAAGLAVLAFANVGPVAAASIGAGGAVATLRRAFIGPAGWGIMPAGSTPRLVMCVAGGLVALWIGAVVMSGSGAPLRVAVMSSIGLAGARVLWSDERAVLLSAVGVLAMAIAVAAVVAADPPGVWPFGAAAIIAASTAFTPAGERAAA